MKGTMSDIERQHKSKRSNRKMSWSEERRGKREIAERERKRTNKWRRRRRRKSKKKNI